MRLEHARLTLISAPAGFGKTTLVTTWLAQLTAVKVAWLSLDENDNDPVRFLTYLAAALQTVEPGLGETAVRLLQSPQAAAFETVLTLLINDISQNGRPLTLVLDDYHVISTPAIHHALAFLLDHQPASLHLLLTTRSDPPLPLSRLRARGQVVELRANDLRFTTEEASQFLNQVMELDISTEALAALEQGTEGWIVGLQLAALSMQGRKDLDGFVAAFTGSNRFVLDYLTDEVLERRPKGTRQFLLKTAVLDRFGSPLCDAVTGEQGSQAILEQLEQANLFLIPLDDQRHWYRYHHLFAEVLHQRLLLEQQDQLPTLHRRAREWFEQHQLMDEAVSQGLAGGDFEQVASLIEAFHDAKWQSGEMKTLQSWLAALPPESWQTHPRLWLVQAWADMTVGDFVEADKKLRGAEAALALLDEEAARKLRPEVIAFRASYASLMQELRTLELAQEALQTLPQDYWLRGMLTVFLSGAYFTMGSLNEALDTLAQAPGAATGGTTEHPHAVHLAAFEGMIFLAMGRLREAMIHIDKALASTEPNGKPIQNVGALMAYMAASLALYEQNKLDELETCLTHFLNLAVNFGSAEVEVFAITGLGRLSLVQGNLVVAERCQAQIEDLLRRHTFTSSITPYIDYFQFLLLLRQGQNTAASAWIEAHSGLTGPLNSYAFHRIALPKLLISQGQYELARGELAGLIETAVATSHGSILIKGLALQALALEGWGKGDEAGESLERALELAAPEGFVRHFVDEGEPMAALLRRSRGQSNFPEFIDLLLAAFRGEEPNISRKALLPEPLTERELEVLDLIGGGASNKEIGARLFIAVPTVKKHVSNILVKLDSKSRGQAIAYARELGLMP